MFDKLLELFNKKKDIDSEIKSEITNLYKKGYPAKQISKVIGKSDNYVLNYIDSENRQSNRQLKQMQSIQDDVIKLYKQGKSILAISKQFEVNYHIIQKIVKQSGIYVSRKPKTQLDKNEVIKLYRQGGSITNIANRFEVSYNRIKRIVNEFQ